MARARAGMALNGVNLPLAYTGQEKIYQKLYNAFGVSNESLSEYFAGPAFLAWNRGQGLLAWVSMSPRGPAMTLQVSTTTHPLLRIVAALPLSVPFISI